MKRCAVLFLLLGVTGSFAGWSDGGYDWSYSNTVCEKMKPKTRGDMKKIKDEDYYTLETNSETFYPGQKLHFRIAGKTKMVKSTYKGLILLVAHDGRAVGTWQDFHMEKYKMIPCLSMNGTAVVEAHTFEKFVQDDVFIWIAPDSCELSKPTYELRATIIRTDKEFLAGMKLQLTCVEKPDEKILPVDSCKANYHAPLPNDTSLEDGFNGWWNSPEAALRWTIHTGPTPSPKTGPSKAYDGEYYAYMEASYPGKKGDYAILNSPPTLSGCLCVRFHCHMWGGPGSYFEARANGKTVWTHKPSADVWLEGYISLNDAYNPVAQIVAHRGVDFRGDIAVDKISYHPGTCPEDL